MKDLITFNAEDILTCYRQKTLSPVEMMRAIFDKLKKYDPNVNAFCFVDEDRSLSEARQSERRWARGEPDGILDGVPISVKDLIAVGGMPTRYGSRTSSRHLESADAPASEALRRSGAILFGKTTTSEFGHKIVTDSPLSGATCNPWDAHYSAGGSSGGSAAAVALGMGPLSLATDGGGSIRIPACWSGVVGFKPSFGLVPAGASSSWLGLSTLGPIARSVRDAALMLTALTRPSGIETASIDYRAGIDSSVAGLRVAYCATPAGVTVLPGIEACLRQAVKTFEGLGARVIESDVMPLREHYGDGHMHSIQWSVYFAQRVRHMDVTTRGLLDPDLVALSEAGQKVPTAVLADALHARHALGVAMEGFFTHNDLLLTPTFRCGPPLVPGLPSDLCRAPTLTAWCNQIGLPAATVPYGFVEGFPTGLQIIGRRGDDALVLRAAHAYELARGTFSTPQMVSSAKIDRSACA